ncbi:MAG TPA: hypothetical protein VMR14_11450 [Streptosporangiaceae bacterium]|jgi:hypothetical protein|nr:hypothetical protein [Streptosporangiaceae bacterium]
MSVRAARVVFPEPDRAEIASAIAEILAGGMLTLGPCPRARCGPTLTAPGSGQSYLPGMMSGWRGEVYDLPLYLQPILKEYALGQSLPVAEKLCARHVCQPVHSDMTEMDGGR